MVTQEEREREGKGEREEGEVVARVVVDEAQLVRQDQGVAEPRSAAH